MSNASTSTSVTDTADLVSQSHAIIYGNSNDNIATLNEITLDSIHSLLLHIIQKLNRIDSMETRLGAIEIQMSDIKQVTDSVSSLTTRVNTMELEVNTVKKTMSDVENNTKAMSDIFDDVKKTSDLKLSTLRQETHQIRDQFKEAMNTMERQSEDLQKSVVDLKSRSMRDNLVFSGIPERDDEDCEEVIQNFLKTKLKLVDDISFERVHRMGKKDEFRTKPRRIVAKFSFFRDRELVRLQAPKKLKGSNIWVNEQFPPEIEEKRKTLYPVMRTARKNGHRVKLVRDSLYIDGRLYVSPALSQDDSDQAENTEHKTDYASVTKVGINTTPKASQRHRYSESDSEYQDRKRACRRRTPNKT